MRTAAWVLALAQLALASRTSVGPEDKSIIKLTVKLAGLPSSFTDLTYGTEQPSQPSGNAKRESWTTIIPDAVMTEAGEEDDNGLPPLRSLSHLLNIDGAREVVPQAPQDLPSCGQNGDAAAEGMDLVDIPSTISLPPRPRGQHRRRGLPHAARGDRMPSRKDSEQRTPRSSRYQSRRGRSLRVSCRLPDDEKDHNNRDDDSYTSCILVGENNDDQDDPKGDSRCSADEGIQQLTHDLIIAD